VGARRPPHRQRSPIRKDSPHRKRPCPSGVTAPRAFPLNYGRKSAAAERGVEDAGLEVGRAAPDHHDRRLPLIAPDTVRQFECRFVQCSTRTHPARLPPRRTDRLPLARAFDHRRLTPLAPGPAVHAIDTKPRLVPKIHLATRGLALSGYGRIPFETPRLNRYVSAPGYSVEACRSALQDGTCAFNKLANRHSTI
jgi:hypothetical protein